MVSSQITRLSFALIAVAVAQQFGLDRAAGQQPLIKVQILANDMCCQGCAQNVAAQLYAAPGVTSVEADVANRTVTVTAKPSPKLTPQRLWQAVEQGKGGPSKLVTAQATYTLTKPESLKQEDRLPVGQYVLVVRELKDREAAQRIANQIYRLRGVSKISLDGAQQALHVQTSGVALSPWVLAAAAEQAQAEPVAVNGPNGLLTIDRTVQANRATAGRPVSPQVQGEIR
jgi:copper chaperone CopZ